MDDCGLDARFVRLLFPPMPMPPPWILLLILLAAFWATENMEEKNPAEVGVWPSLPSGVGESGARVMLESLLGPILADPDFVLRCVFAAA